MSGRSSLAVAAGQIVSAVRRRLADRGGRLLVALDGGSGAGKSTLAELIAAELDATVVISDDFFHPDGTPAEWDAFPPAQRVAKGIDWRRLRAEALEPLLAGRSASWRPFAWPDLGSGLSDEVVTRQPADVIILDGIYSARPELADLVGLAVFVSAPASVRHRRHDVREGGDESAWHARWDAAEDYYFTHDRCRRST